MTAVRSILLGTAGMVALAGCTVPPELSDPQSRTRQGALLGAALGGAAGYASDDEDRARRAAIGAAAGAAAGAAIGQRLDQQERDLRNRIGNDRIGIENTGSELVVTMPQDILFATDSSTVRPDLRADLRVLAANLQDYPNSTVDVIGHTDNTGSASYNQRLSERRASSVASVLLGQGVASNRIRVIGRGENQPIATNLSPEGRSQNRRVEVVIRPISTRASAG